MDHLGADEPGIAENLVCLADLTGGKRRADRAGAHRPSVILELRHDIDREAEEERVWFAERLGFFDAAVWIGDRTGPKTRIEPLSTMRQKIAEHMVMSKRTSPHVTTVHRVDMTKVAKMRERHKAQFQASYGFSLTYLPFITRAAVVALRQYPLLNASLDNNNIIYHNEMNIGIAVALENGLIVPVIRGADEKNVLGLQRSIVDLAGRVLGQHRGITRFTVGQRRGLEIGGSADPLYVVRIEAGRIEDLRLAGAQRPFASGEIGRKWL